MSDKTEKPTNRRLRQAREKGDVAVSGPFGQALGFIAALALLPALARAAFALFAALITSAVEGRALSPFELAEAVLVLSLPIVAAAALASALLAFAQSGGLFALTRVSPDLSRLDPIAGLRGLAMFWTLCWTNRSPNSE